jgi:ubiquinone/menaquinone biosynthesis C-methylase UbiE
MPFSDNQFDVLFAGSIFDEFVYEQNQPAMVKEIVRVLKPGGVFVYGFLFAPPPYALGLDVVLERKGRGVTSGLANAVMYQKRA